MLILQVGNDKSPKIMFSCNLKADMLLPLLAPSVKSLRYEHMHDEVSAFPGVCPCAVHFYGPLVYYGGCTCPLVCDGHCKLVRLWN